MKLIMREKDFESIWANINRLTGLAEIWWKEREREKERAQRPI